MSNQQAVNDVAKGVIEVHPIAGRIGAKIKGVNLSVNLDAAAKEAINAALLKYKVIFFRNQNHLDDASQEALADLFGSAIAHPTVPTKNGTSYVLELDSAHGGRADSWHTDVTFAAAYPAISILRAVEVPASGGDTVWANAAAAYDNLPESLRNLVDGLWAVHSNEYDYAANRNQISERDARQHREVFASTVYETEHPVVHVHPETGERSLILGHFAKRIVGLSKNDSAQLIALLQSHITRLENTVRWRWQAGDVAIWDNRATQHYAINDYGDQHRVVRRVTVDGVVPVSIDGRRSIVRQPAPAEDASASQDGQKAG